MQRKLHEKMKSIYKIIVLIIWTISVQSCDVQKKALKTKTATTTNTDKSETTDTKRFDFTKTNVDLEEFEFKPTNPLFAMEIVTPDGDTIKAKNTTISKKKQNTQTFNNKQEQTNTNIKDNSVIDESSKFKDTEKQETFNPQYFIYALAVLVLLVIIGFIFLANQINKIKTLIP